MIIHLLTIVSSYATGKYFDHIEHMSEKDQLTGIYNRRYVHQAFKIMTDLMHRNGTKYVLMVIDCNNFKQINDQKGHDVGDQVLKSIAHVLRSTTRTSDIIARWGGDEFLFIGEYKTDGGIEVIKNRIMNGIENMSKKINHPISISVGHALYPDEHSNLDDLVKIADGKMYQHKSQSKSRLHTCDWNNLRGEYY